MPSDTTTITVPTAKPTTTSTEAGEQWIEPYPTAPTAPPAADLDAIEAAMAGRTEGEWRVADDCHDRPRSLTSTATPGESLLGLDSVGMAVVWDDADARAIVAAVNAVTALIAELRRLRALVAQGVPRG